MLCTFERTKHRCNLVNLSVANSGILNGSQCNEKSCRQKLTLKMKSPVSEFLFWKWIGISLVNWSDIYGSPEERYRYANVQQVFFCTVSYSSANLKGRDWLTMKRRCQAKYLYFAYCHSGDISRRQQWSNENALSLIIAVNSLTNGYNIFGNRTLNFVDKLGQRLQSNPWVT